MRDKGIKIRDTLKQHILNNKKEYIVVMLFFLVGIFLGVFFVNNIQETQRMEISSYLTNFIEKMKTTENLNYMDLLKNSMGQNILLAIMIWFFGTTVIRDTSSFWIVFYRGFCLGYTISVCVSILGIGKGILFTLLSLVLQNLIFIPATLALAVSGFKLYKSIIRDNRKENIKLEIVRHTIFSFIMLILLLLSSVIEILVSTNLLKIFIKYF